ncbi:hypothetical protein PHYPSEUDO_009414 [Phytophthora pseudosyringae]|uniref:Uncharacterized protein n=1 Tax=Phytophthora pseudosyringae TaxID=221518 RepID=A0A8T1VFF4_9STRA|nr:hypothetical protein PHYPSEUDO_009414 [Phytophthora pseudosyringae]
MSYRNFSSLAKGMQYMGPNILRVGKIAAELRKEAHELCSVVNLLDLASAPPDDVPTLGSSYAETSRLATDDRQSLGPSLVQAALELGAVRLQETLDAWPGGQLPLRTVPTCHLDGIRGLFIWIDLLCSSGRYLAKTILR